MIIVSCLVIVLFVFSIKKHTPIFESSIGMDGYSVEGTKAIKGVLALCIVLCHLTNRVEYQLPFVGFSAMGSIGVGCFFFLSGYALVVSANRKQYFEGFVRKRFTKVLIPYFIMMFIYLLIMSCTDTSLAYIGYSFIKGYPVNNSWYVFGCLYCYLVFFVSFKLNKDNYLKAIVSATAGILAYIIVVIYFLEWPDWWYKTIICFLLGLIWGVSRNRIQEVLSKHYYLLCSFAIAMATISYLIPYFNNHFLNIKDIDIYLINDVAMAISYTLLLAVLMYKFTLKNRVTHFLGEISYEIYLYHGLIMDAIRYIGAEETMKTRFQQEMYSFLVMALTISIAVLMHKLDVRILNIIERKKGRVNAKS